MGSWLLYGLGAETDDLPGFIVLHLGRARRASSRCRRGNGRPASCRASSRASSSSRKGDAVHYIGNPDGRRARARSGRSIEEVNRLNGMLAEDRLDPEIQTRIAQYELAFRMQTSVPELTDFGSEPQERPRHVRRQAAGRRQLRLELPAGPAAGRARRAVHPALPPRLGPPRRHRARHAQRPRRTSTSHARRWSRTRSSAGMLDDTLVIWGGEFGRTPMGQGTGRDHHILSFSIWMAGGGIKGGMTYGATDELGYRAVENVVHVRDLHATMLHLCGIDHERLTFKFQGLDVRLTGVEPARVVKEMLA